MRRVSVRLLAPTARALIKSETISTDQPQRHVHVAERCAGSEHSARANKHAPFLKAALLRIAERLHEVLSRSAQHDRKQYSQAQHDYPKGGSWGTVGAGAPGFARGNPGIQQQPLGVAAFE